MSSPVKTYRIAGASWCGYTKKLKEDLGISEYDTLYEYSTDDNRVFHLTMVDCSLSQNKQDDVCKQSSGFPNTYRQEGSRWVSMMGGYSPDAYQKLLNDVNTSSSTSRSTSSNNYRNQIDNSPGDKYYEVAGASWCGYTRKLKDLLKLSDYGVPKKFNCGSSKESFTLNMIDCSKNENKSRETCRNSKGFPHTFIKTANGYQTAINGYNPNTVDLLCKGNAEDFSKQAEWSVEFNRRMDNRAKHLKEEMMGYQQKMKNLQEQIKSKVDEVKKEMMRDYPNTTPPF